ncbi:hypothetical protein ABEF93_002042 [Exophiala dermatitidis]
MSNSSTSSRSRTRALRSLSATTLRPARKKARLYIALYPRGGSSTTSSFRNHFTCDSYHWSLVVAPPTASRKDVGSTRYHVAHAGQHTASASSALTSTSGGGDKYLYEEQDIASTPAAQTGLVRITVAKVVDEARLRALLRDIPVPQHGDDDPTFNCLTWVREAFVKAIEDPKCVKSYLHAEDWKAVETCARTYCKRKRDLGRFHHPPVQPENDDANAGIAFPWSHDDISTFNFWENRETTA